MVQDRPSFKTPCVTSTLIIVKFCIWFPNKTFPNRNEAKETDKNQKFEHQSDKVEQLQF